MLLVGLTGGIASGKSLVLRVLEDLGARTIDADQVGKDLTAPGSQAIKEVVRHFGPDYLLPDGQLNRPFMAETIFGDPEKRRLLENILHPRIGGEIESRIERFAIEDPSAVVVVEAALMIEINYHEDFDKLLVVYADEESQVERLMARDKLSRHEAYRRLNAQMPLEAKLDVADYVIDNSGRPEEAIRETIKIFNHLKKLAAVPAPPER